MSETAEFFGKIMYTQGSEVQVAVEKLAVTDIDTNVAFGVLGLDFTNYQAQFEPTLSSAGQLRAGSSFLHFKPFSYDSLYAARDRFIDQMDAEGARHFIVKAEGALLAADDKLVQFDPKDIVGYARLSADSYYIQAKSREEQSKQPIFRLDDLQVHPYFQRLGIGSALVRSAVMTMDGFGPDVSLIADAVKDNDGPNRFLTEDMGLEPKDELLAPQMFGDSYLEVIRFGTPEGFGLAGIVARLEERRSWLRNAALLPAN